jgi:hypothetical protein
MLSRLDEDSFHYGGAINVSSLALAPAAKVESEPVEENPDSPEVATTPVAEDEEEKNEPGPPHD